MLSESRPTHRQLPCNHANIDWQHAAAADESDWPQPERLQELVRAYMHHAPLALVLRELNRLLAIDRLPPVENGRVLDVGCGDGFWWTLRDRHGCDITGVDIDPGEVAAARARIEAEIVDVAATVPIGHAQFDEIIGNCSLEHVPDLNAALSNLHAAAKPSARLVLFVPSRHWAMHGRMQRQLMAKTPRIGMALAGALDGFFQHWHVYDVPVWKDLLARSKWRLKAAYGLGNDNSEYLYRLFLPQAFAGFAYKQAFGRYPSRALGFLPSPLRRRLESLLTSALENPLVDASAPSAYEYMLVAEATSEGS